MLDLLHSSLHTREQERLNLRLSGYTHLFGSSVGETVFIYLFFITLRVAGYIRTHLLTPGREL